MKHGNAETQRRRNADDWRLAIGDCRLQPLKLGDFESDAEFVDVLVVPDGEVKSSSGDFIMDDVAWAEMERAFRDHDTDLLFDYEHQSLGGKYNNRPDGLAPAAGWIKDLRREKGRGVVAKVQWTEEAKRRIKAREYKYPSPTIWVRHGDKRAVGLKSVGLVNEPAIVGMERVAAKEPMPEVSQHQEKNMDLQKELQKCLGAADTDSAEVLVNKVGELKKKADGSGSAKGTVAAVCKALGVAETASETEIVARVTAMKADQTAITTQGEELKALKAKIAERDADELIRVHGAGKLNPNATEEMAVFRKLAVESPDVFIKVMAERPAILEGGRTTATTDPVKKAGGAKEDELIAAALKEHKNDYGAAIASLQVALKAPLLERGLTSKAANAQCAEQYPKIFAV